MRGGPLRPLPPRRHPLPGSSRPLRLMGAGRLRTPPAAPPTPGPTCSPAAPPGPREAAAGPWLQPLAPAPGDPATPEPRLTGPSRSAQPRPRPAHATDGQPYGPTVSVQGRRTGRPRPRCARSPLPPHSSRWPMASGAGHAGQRLAAPGRWGRARRAAAAREVRSGRLVWWQRAPWGTPSLSWALPRTTSRASSRTSWRCWPSWKVGAGPAAAPSPVVREGCLEEGRRTGAARLEREGPSGRGRWQASCQYEGTRRPGAAAVNFLSWQARRLCHPPGTPGPRRACPG